MAEPRFKFRQFGTNVLITNLICIKGIHIKIIVPIIKIQFQLAVSEMPFPFYKILILKQKKIILSNHYSLIYTSGFFSYCISHSYAMTHHVLIMQLLCARHQKCRDDSYMFWFFNCLWPEG